MIKMAERVISLAESILEAMAEEMERDQTVFLLGEGVAGGTWIDTSILAKKFPDRVVDTPICEDTIVGAGVGAALMGMRPVLDIHVNDFLLRAMDQLVNEAAKIQYVSGGQTKLPIVVRASVNTGLGNGVNHSQSLEALFMHTPGLQIAVPTTPYDAKGLLKTAIRGGNPVMFFEPGRLYFKKGLVPKEEYLIPFGEAVVRRQGRHVTVVAEMYMVDIAVECASKLEKEGIDVEVLEPRTLVPLDKNAIVESVKKTGRLVTAEMGCKMGGMGAEVAAVVAEECLDYLDAPVRRVAARDTPVPFSRALERAVLPSESDLASAIKEVMA